MKIYHFIKSRHPVSFFFRFLIFFLLTTLPFNSQHPTHYLEPLNARFHPVFMKIYHFIKSRHPVSFFLRFLMLFFLLTASPFYLQHPTHYFKPLNAQFHPVFMKIHHFRKSRHPTHYLEPLNARFHPVFMKIYHFIKSRPPVSFFLRFLMLFFLLTASQFYSQHPTHYFEPLNARFHPVFMKIHHFRKSRHPVDFFLRFLIFVLLTTLPFYSQHPMHYFKPLNARFCPVFMKIHHFRKSRLPVSFFRHFLMFFLYITSSPFNPHRPTHYFEPLNA
jgi:dimeric dUTPase (all-alpha-NTP-PPase superfamily)